MTPSFTKSTLSLMAFICFLFVLGWATYSITTGVKIELPDWIVGAISGILSSYGTSRFTLSQQNNDTK